MATSNENGPSAYRCLDENERVELQALRLRDRWAEERLCQLDRVLTSKLFKASQHTKLQGFLEFVVTQAVLGRDHQIKETTIALAVWGESGDFDSALTSKVRGAAGTVRKKLSEYRNGEGRSDPIEIQMEVGTYVPRFLDRRAAILVPDLFNWNPNDDQSHLCRNIPDQIVYCLNRNPGVLASRSAAHDRGAGTYLLRGTFECRRGMLRVNASCGDLRTGSVVGSGSYEHPDSLLQIADQIAKMVLLNIRDGATSPADDEAKSTLNPDPRASR